MTTEVLVCVTCRAAEASREAPRAGRLLFEAIQEKAFCDELPLTVRPIECMSGCSRSCTVAFQAPGKHSYLFGDLVADKDSIKQILDCAQLHATSGDGLLPRDKRPERLQNGLIARLPAPLS
ncbi:DUF1636 family protein [Noviherbaspirillum sedimenti]|uniref:DUF1636 domain-containing protein n=1 Tax=Noviherbaspirillum sedimenti TaxID=2320865 RepID=A0A3A3FYA4_9BURK|nr:DUF1636 domain-containing protein [Noviherbaspirillum sedimenti]RJG00345.1 DUF1636 domain-containing protein [Noviherbaspirillum sedimenti]